MLKCLICNKEFLYAGKLTREIGALQDILETHVCPYCQNVDIREVEEPTEPQPKVESIISVKIGEVDAFLKQGYEVKDTYASSATLIKKVKETQAQ